MPPPLVLVAVMGTTASGKTGLAEALADHLDARLINADAFQVYRYLDIGTAKSERKAEYALIDIRDPNEPFGAGEWVRLAAEELGRTFESGRHAVIVGGSGFYIRALLEGYDQMLPPPDPMLREALDRKLQTEGLEGLLRQLDTVDPEAGSRVDRMNPARVRRAIERALTTATPVTIEPPGFIQVKIGLDLPKQLLDLRISQRVEQMVQNAWTQEVENLISMGFGPSDPGFRAHGYRWMARHLSGEIELKEAIAATIAEVRSYSKRQRTWLRREPNLIALPGGEPDLLDQALDVVRRPLQ